MIILPFHQNYNLRLQRSIWISFSNIFPFFHQLRDWRKIVSDYGANFLSQSLKLNSTRTEDYFERQQNSHTFFIFRTSCVNFSEVDQTFRPSCQNPNLHVQKSIPERKKILDQNIIFHIIFGLRADIFSTFDKHFPALLKILVFTSPAHQFDFFLHNSDALIHFEI